MESAENIVALATAVVMLISLAANGWQGIKNRKWQQVARDGHEVALTIAAGLERASRLNPGNEGLKQAKQYVKGLAERIGHEEERLAPMLEELDKRTRYIITGIDEADNAFIVQKIRDVAASETRDAARMKAPRNMQVLSLVLVACILGLGASGCAIFEPTLRPDAAISHRQTNYEYTPELLAATPMLAEVVTEEYGEGGQVVKRSIDRQWGFPPAPAESRFSASEAFADSETNLKTFSNTTGAGTTVERQTAIDAEAYASGAVLQQQRTDASLDAIGRIAEAAALVYGVKIREEASTDRARIEAEMERFRLELAREDEEPEGESVE